MMKVRTAKKPIVPQVLAIEGRGANTTLFMRLLPLVILLAITGTIFSIIYFYHFMPRAIGKLQIDKFVISSKRHAFVEKLNVRYGDKISAGHTVIELDIKELLARKKEAEEKIKAAVEEIGATKSSLQLRQDELRLRLDDNLIFRAMDMEAARANLKENTATLESAIEKLKGAEIELKRRTSLLSLNAISQASVDEIQTRYNALVKEVQNYEKVVQADEKRFEASVKRYDEYNEKNINIPIEEILKPIITEVEVAKSQLNAIEALISYSMLKAPSDGYVLGVHKSVGEAVDVADPILTIINGTQYLVESYVRERWMISARKGRKVKLVPVSGTETLYGEIIFVADGISRIPQEYLKPYEQEIVNGLRFIVKLDKPSKGPLGSTLEVFFR